MGCFQVIFALSALFCYLESGAMKISHFINNSDSGDGKFLWDLKNRLFDSVEIVANVSTENASERSSKKIGTDSLSPDKDKTENFVNQYQVTEPEIEDIQTRHTPGTFSWDSFVPSFKLPLLEKKTIILTTTVLQKQTLYNPVYPSCLLLQNVQSVCDGVLKTVLPTRMKPIADFWHLKETASMESVEQNEDAERFIQPSSTVSIQASSTILPAIDQSVGASKEVFSSEWNFEDDQKSVSLEKSSKATPILSKKDASIRNEVDDEGRMVPFLEPKIQFVTKYLTIRTTEARLDTAHTATVIAENCLPADLHVPLCSSYPFPGNSIGTFVVSPYSEADSQPAGDENLPLDDLTRDTVARMKALMRDLLNEDVQRMADENGYTPPVFQQINLPGNYPVPPVY